MVTINNKKYDENKFSAGTKAIYSTLVEIQNQEKELKLQLMQVKEHITGLSTALSVAAQSEQEEDAEET